MPRYSVYYVVGIEVEVTSDDPKTAAKSARFQILNSLLNHVPPRFVSVGFLPDYAWQVRPILDVERGKNSRGDVVASGADKDLDPR